MKRSKGYTIFRKRIAIRWVDKKFFSLSEQRKGAGYQHKFHISRNNVAGYPHKFHIAPKYVAGGIHKFQMSPDNAGTENFIRPTRHPKSGGKGKEHHNTAKNIAKAWKWVLGEIFFLLSPNSLTPPLGRGWTMAPGDAPGHD